MYSHYRQTYNNTYWPTVLEPKAECCMLQKDAALEQEEAASLPWTQIPGRGANYGPGQAGAILRYKYYCGTMLCALFVYCGAMLCALFVYCGTMLCALFVCHIWKWRQTSGQALRTDKSNAIIDLLFTAVWLANSVLMIGLNPGPRARTVNSVLCSIIYLFY